MLLASVQVYERHPFVADDEVRIDQVDAAAPRSSVQDPAASTFLTQSRPAP
jgi:hypothetical protein